METIYELLGGEAAIRRLVDRFYDVMSEDPRAADILKLHPRNLDSSRNKLFLFLSGWCGGPQLYIEKYGHPRLRMRHAPFPIATTEAEAWMICMRQALADEVENPELRGQLEQSFTGVAAHMRNRQG